MPYNFGVLFYFFTLPEGIENRVLSADFLIRSVVFYLYDVAQLRRQKCLLIVDTIPPHYVLERSEKFPKRFGVRLYRGQEVRVDISVIFVGCMQPSVFFFASLFYYVPHCAET